MHEGHRQRMLERLEDAKGLRDHELLEILLYNAIPRKNTNELAHLLLSTFGSLNELFRADFEELVNVEGIGKSTAAYLRCIGLAFERSEMNKCAALPCAASFEKLSAFVHERLKGLDREVIELYALDGRFHVRRSIRFSSNEADKARISPEDVTKFFSLCHPKSVIAAHNHLYNNAQPSEADDAFTAKLALACSFYGIPLYDHIIFSPIDLFSYRMHGRERFLSPNPPPPTQPFQPPIRP